MHNSEITHSKEKSHDSKEAPALDSEVTKNQSSVEILQMLMATMGNQQSNQVTEDHINELLAQRRQVNEYVNEDRKRSSWDKKYYLTIGLAFILLISCLIIFTHPEFFTQVLSLIIGGFGGFGLGKVSKED